MSAADEKVVALVERHLEPILRRQALVLYDVEYHRGPRSGILRVYVDCPGGVDVEACARVSEVLSRLLDVEDPIPGAYHLEVSSPGLTRKLTKPRHYRGSAGKRVRLELREPREGGERRVEGTLRELAGEPGHEEVVVDTEGGEVRVPLGRVASAQLVLDGPFGGKR